MMASEVAGCGAVMAGSLARDRSVGGRVELANLPLVGIAVILSIGVVVSLPSRDAEPPISGTGPVVTLPSPRTTGPLSLEEALASRRSVRGFTGAELTSGEIGQLLWSAQGVTDAAGHRTAPSAGALYPLELDVVTADGLARYEPDGHRLAFRSLVDLRPALRLAALDQAAVEEAPVVIVISGVVERTAARYGVERAERYVALEAGHAAQNVLLEAVSLGLGAVPMGAFADQAVRQVLDLPDGESPLYLIPVGRPR